MEQRNWADPFWVKMYAQTDEESILKNLIDAFSPNERFGENFIVDIGAGDGSNLSNSRAIMDLLGWRAFRVDGAYADPSKSLVQSWITADTIVALMTDHGVPKSFGVLSIDIDGQDLYVLDALLSGGFRPSVVCFEFNGCRKPDSFHVVPADPNFRIHGDHYGASWNAFKHVLGLHGYTCVHHTHDMNGFAVDNALQPVPCATMPSYNQYHPHNPEGEWLDATTIFRAG